MMWWARCEEPGRRIPRRAGEVSCHGFGVRHPEKLSPARRGLWLFLHASKHFTHHTMRFPHQPLFRILSTFPLLFSSLASAEEEAVVFLPVFTVISPHDPAPLRVMVDPRAPAQPVPSQDGADLLRSVAGFNVIRKGGTDGDPVFRGLSGSRLGILIDGELIFGGCGNRMDPPTAYVFPAAFQSVTVIKGPQSVLHGPGMSAGVVLFERQAIDFGEESLSGMATLSLGSHGRNDQMLEALYAHPKHSLGVTLTRSASDDYADGDGRKVPSQYERWSAHLSLGVRLGPATRLEATGILSDGEAAYADRAMDGVAFTRENLGLRFSHDLADAGWLTRIEALAYYNYVDHVMDNYSLRPFSPTAMMQNPSVSNPDRETLGARLLAHLGGGDPLKATLGVEYQANTHTTRRSMNQSAQSYQDLPRVRDARLETPGLLAEASHAMGDHRLVGGVRADFWRAEDPRQSVAVGMMNLPNPTAGARRRETLPSGFLRYEHSFADSLLGYLGIGHAERFPDYWELVNKESATSLSAFLLEAERTTQVDFGFHRSTKGGSFGLSAFANRIDDFILIESGVAKGTRRATISRNVDASMLGLEASAQQRLGDHWQVDAAMAYVRGRNRSDGIPLAQQPPLEGRVALAYHGRQWSSGALVRMVAPQRRVAPGQGSIVGQDLGPSSGFAVFSLHADWRPTPHLRVSAGIDNLLDRDYAEHLSRGGAMVAGFPPPTTRVNEPGRTFWLRGEYRF